MTLRRSELKEAHEELLAAARWYDDQRSGLGDVLLDAVDTAIESILDWPDAAPPFPGWDQEPVVRLKGVDDFPYRIVYLVRDGELIIGAYAHERRKPGYWKRRLDG